MTCSNAHTQSYIAQEKQLVINELREKVTVAYKRIRELEQEIQDKVSEINTLKEELQLLKYLLICLSLFFGLYLLEIFMQQINVQHLKYTLKTRLTKS